MSILFSRIGENLEESIPNTESIILTNNSMQELGDLDVLSTLPNLRTLRLVTYCFAHFLVRSCINAGVCVNNMCSYVWNVGMKIVTDQ